MRAFPIVLVLAVVGLSRPAAAQLATSTHARTAAMADAVTAGADASSAVAHNPAGLGELEGTTAVISTQAATSRLWSAQTDRPRARFQQDVLGFGLTLAARLPGPPMIRRLRLGIDLYTPPTHFIRLEAAPRTDQPSWPLYGQRLDHLKATLAAGVEVTDNLSLGAGIMVHPVLTANTIVAYEAGRGDSTAENVVVNADRSLSLGTAGVFGARLRLGSQVAFGASYRQRQGARIDGRTSVGAGSVLIEDTLDFFQTWNPAEIAFGAHVSALRPVAVSADLVWSRWSDYRTIRNDATDPAFSDVVNVRLGSEWTVSRPLRLRGGYGFEPTPVPAQVADSNLLDATRHVVSLGAGFDFAALDLAPFRIDFHVRGNLLQTTQSTKQAARLTDSDADAPGHQIDNLGYPGFQAGGQFWQTGLAVVFGGGSDE